MHVAGLRRHPDAELFPGWIGLKKDLSGPMDPEKGVENE